MEERIGYQARGFELRWSRRISGAGVFVGQVVDEEGSDSEGKCLLSCL